MYNFEGKTVLIAGGASGIGAACSLKFSELGAKVIILDIDTQRSLQLLSSFGNSAAPGYFYRCDLSDQVSCFETMKTVLARHLNLDALVNSCGIIHRETVLDTDCDDWDRVIDTNLKSVFLMSKHVLPVMINQGHGAVINIASGWGLSGGRQASAYCASKGGVVLLTKAMALDFGHQNIRVNCVCPGDTDTPLLAREAELVGEKIDQFREAGKSRPLGRIGQPEEVANVVTFLASEQSSFMTGSCVVVDGGSLAGTG